MIRILHIVTYMGRGGIETMLMNYYRHVDREKIQFDFLVHRDFEADYDREIRELGGRIYHIPRLVPWSHSYKRKLKKFFHEHPEYRIIHVHQDCLSSVALKCAKECGIPVRIAHSHNCGQEHDLKYPVKRYYMRYIPDYATDFFACSKAAGDWMFRGHEYRVLPNAIDAEKYVYSESMAKRVRDKFEIGNSILVGHVGRFCSQKNHNFLIDIFSEMNNLNPDVKLLLAGDGDEKQKVEKRVESLGLKEKVIFAGSRDDVCDLMQAMDVFVLPSLYEGLGMVVIEAQAAGLPCVVSDGVPEECSITEGLVTWKSLSDTPEDWARHVLAQLGKKRESHMINIRNAGYNIDDAARRLETFYMDASTRG